MVGLPLDEWEDELWWAMRRVLLVMLACVKRRLVDAWDCWPWGLGLMYDPRRPLHERRKAAADFAAKRRCCLDRCCSLRFRDQILRDQTGDGVDELMEDWVSRAMIAILNSVRISTQFLECGFAAVKQALLKSNRPLSMTSLSARWVAETFLRLFRETEVSDCPQTDEADDACERIFDDNVESTPNKKESHDAASVVRKESKEERLPQVLRGFYAGQEQLWGISWRLYG